MLRFIYKVVYFYSFPILVIFVGYIAWVSENIDEFHVNKYAKVDHSLSNFKTLKIDTEVMMYSFFVLSLFFLAIYAILYVENLHQIKRTANENTKVLLGYLVFSPFAFYAIYMICELFLH